MNKIFKKVWNRRRGCFVAVSEAMTAASQSSKTSVIIGSALLLSGMMAANAAVTVNGNTSWNDIDYLFHDNGSSMIHSDYVINGSLTVPYRGSGWTFIAFDCSHGDTGRPIQSLTVRDNMTLDNQTIFILAGHGSGRGGSNGTLSVGGDLNVNGSLFFAGDRGGETGSVQVNGILRVGQSGTLGDSIYGNASPKISLNANVLDTSGNVDFKTGTGSINFGKVIVRGGNYVESSAVPMTISQGLELLGGTFVNRNPIVVGQNVGNYLILGGGHFSNAPTLGIKNNSTVSVTGGSYNFTTLSKENGSLSNAATLSITNFNQSNGSSSNSGNLSIGNANLFGTLVNNGTLTLTGNVTSRGNLTNSGNLNNRGNWTETNRVTIAGNLNNTGSVNFQNGFQFGNGRLTSSGTIQTNNALDIFDSLGTTGQQDLHYVALNSTVPQEAKTSLTDFFLKYLPGTVAKSLADHASFTGGKVIVTGVNLTQTQAADLAKAFKEQFGSATTLEFQGTIAGVSHDDKLTVAKTNELYDNVEHLRDVIFVDRKLEGENGAIVIGNSGLRNNTGFTGINEATGTTIQDGKELTLIGGKSDGTGNRFTLAEKVISAVGSGAKLILGSLGIKDSSLYQGQASEVNLSNGGELRIAAGDYLVTNHTSSGGTTTVDKNSTFRSDNGTFTDKAVLENNGETVLGALNGWNSAEVRNNGKLTVSGNTQFGGRFINNANAKLVGTADIDGTLQNSQGARLIANTVNVNGTLRNFGYMEALDNSTVFGTLENPGEIRLFNTAIGSRGDGNIGTIGNTYTLKATGKTQVSGLIANASGAVAEFTGDDSELTVLSGGVVSNNGTLIADSLVINNGGYFINGDNAQQTFATSPLRLRKVARAVARATEQLKNLTVSEGGSKTNNGIAYYGTGSIAGEFINASGAEAFGGVSDIFVDGSGLGITNTGSIKNAGTFTFGGTLNNSGSITGDGLIVFKRAGLGNDTFTNAGQINVGSLEADNIKYVQTAGSLSSASGWFSNSTVDLTGGTIEHTVLGSGNTYNLGAGSGSNDAATFTVGTLDSSSYVEIRRGATLRTEHIAMNGNKTTNLVGGRLSTTLDQIFTDLDYSTLNLDAVNPEDKVEVSSNPQIVTGIGNVIGSVAQGIAFQWGTVAFDDASYSAALAGDAVNKLVAIGDVPADRRGELEVAFNGKAAERFNVDLANSIRATADGTLAYATFANETLSNESAANPGATSLVIGVNDRTAVVVPTSGTPNVLNQSMGFMNVAGVSDGLYINSGSHFVLVGQAQPNPNLALVELTDGAVWVGGNRNDNGNLTPSKLTLGSYGSAAATKGHLAELNIGISPANNKIGGAGGQVIVKNGEFTVDVLNNGSAGYGNDREGLVIGNADDTATQLIVGSYTAVDGSAMSNHGIFKAQNIASRNTNNSFVNHGTFDIGTADISGYLENNGTADFNELTLREYGSVNKQGAELTAGKLTVSGNALAGASGTYGIRGSLENQGKLSVTDELTVAGDMTNSGEVDIAKLTVQAATPVQDATAGSFINNALAKMDSLLTEAGSLVTNAADAVLTIAGLNGASELNGTVTNDGTLKVDGTQSVTVASGELNNNGTMENTNALNVTGGTVGNNGSLALNGLNVTGGQVQNSAQAAQFKDSGTTKIEMADASDVGIANEGHLELSNLMLLKGMIQGGSVGSKDVTLADVRQDASIEAEKVQFKELNNAGTVKVIEFAATKTENTGTVEAGHLVLAENDRFLNQAAGSVKADQLVLNGGEFVNAGGNTSDIALTQIATGGQFTSDGDSNLQKVVSNEGTINLNKGNLNIAELDAKNSVYNQLGGHFMADKGFFADSTLNIKGGIFDASEVRDSEGNVTGLLGNNTVNISGGNKTPVIDNEDSAENKSHYKDNLTQVVAGGDVNNIGDIETGKLTIDDGLVKIDGGSLKAEETDLNGGDLVIGNDREPSEENHVKAEINPEGDVIDTNIYVKNNGDLNLGPTGGLDWADSIGSPTVPSGTPSRLVITNNVTTGPGGGIAVGPNVWSDKDNHVQIGNGDLFFAKDSLTVIDSSILTDGKSAFNTTSDIAKVTVEQGANLVLGNIDEVGDYTIVNGYITGGNESDDGMWTGGWTGDNLYALPQDGSGINWILTLHNDPSKIWVNATLADVRTVYPDIAIPNIANDDLLHCKSGDAGADFVCRVLRDKELDVAGKTKVINSVANIAFAGGAMSVSMNDLNTAADSIEGRVSMRNEAFTEYGVMREWERGNDLWVDVIGGKQKYKSLSATGISKAGFDTNAYGLVMGYDRKLAGKSVLLGAAFSYSHGSLDSTGDVLKTKNKYDSFGLHAYGAYAPVDRVNLIGTLSWMHNSSDITQSINAAGFNKADADVKTNLFSLGARAEATLPVGKANVIPHAGLRYVWAKSGSYDTKVDGKKVWGNTPDATNTFQLPVGVAVRGDIMTASGWNVRPQADLTLIPQFGDTEQKTKLSNFNGVSDKLSGEFAGKFGTNVNLGVQADKGPATFGVRYGFTGGTKGKADHAFKFEARYRF